MEKFFSKYVAGPVSIGFTVIVMVSALLIGSHPTGCEPISFDAGADSSDASLDSSSDSSCVDGACGALDGGLD